MIELPFSVDRVSFRTADQAPLAPTGAPPKVVSVVSVSYTHLDVYKRQQVGPARVQLYGMIRGLECFLGASLAQIYGCLLYTSRCV